MRSPLSAALTFDYVNCDDRKGGIPRSRIPIGSQQREVFYLRVKLIHVLARSVHRYEVLRSY